MKEDMWLYEIGYELGKFAQLYKSLELVRCFNVFESSHLFDDKI